MDDILRRYGLLTLTEMCGVNPPAEAELEWIKYVRNKIANVAFDCVFNLIKCQNNGQINQLLSSYRTEYSDIVQLKDYIDERAEELGV